MFRFAAIVALVLSLVVPIGAQAQQPNAAAVQVLDPWARATAVSAKNGAVYMTLVNKGASDDRLVAASTGVAARVELHTVIRDGEVMRMRQVKAIEVKPAAPTELRPGGFHVMLLGLTAPLKDGDRFPLTLTFEKAGTVAVEVSIRTGGGAGPAHQHGKPTH